ncbi:histidine phosphatase superfamily [Syncephalis plumigaleata]|nr:histidine phosphatase superfamily [Syncephalis plumigaleata]
MYLPVKDDGYAARWARSKKEQASLHITVIAPLTDLLSASAPYPLQTSKQKGQAGRVPDTCDLVHFQLLVRDGTRSPSLVKQTNLHMLETELAAQVSSDWPTWLQQWRSPYGMDQLEQLSGQGRRDLALLAQRDLKRYRRWLHSLAYERHQSAWYSSADTPTAIESAQAYASAFSGRRLSNELLHITPLHEDKELAPHIACSSSLSSRNPKAMDILTDLRTKYMPSIKRTLTRQLGFTPTEKLVRAMAQACVHEFTHDHIVDQWCSLLEPAAVEALTSHHATTLTSMTIPEDGSPPSYMLCILFSRILQEMNSHVAGRLDPLWRLRFTSLETFLLVLDFLVSKQATLPCSHHDNTSLPEPPTLGPDRTYRLSHIAPFAANIHIELLRCNESKTIMYEFYTTKYQFVFPSVTII